MLKFEWLPFSALTGPQVYAMWNLRERVFVLEQKCAYLDADFKDPLGMHLLAWDASGRLTAYLRVLPPGTRYKGEHSIGRVVSSPEARRTGAGRALMAEALKQIEATYGHVPIRISAQAYLERFYSDFGFKTVSPETYLEDDIPHLEMLRN